MITTPQSLANLTKILASSWIALDTEADSLHAYPEKICLIQISSSGRDDLIDPLANMDLAPLWQVLKGRELILHGSDYDLRLFRRIYEFVPHQIFDTMLAARLLGYTKFGLSDLTQQFLNVTLEKGPQKANWARRPLTERMEAYARNDTHYLKALYDLLHAQLKEKGRLAWLEESCARLIADCAELRPADEDSVWRIKGSFKLRPAGLAVLRELWHWREGEAIAANRPPFFILSHDLLVSIADAAAHQRPVDPLLPRHLYGQRRSGLTKAVQQGLSVPPHQQPQIPRPVRHHPTEAEKRRFAALQTFRDDQAKEFSMDPTLIASRAQLEALSRDPAKAKTQLMKWQLGLLEPVLN